MLAADERMLGKLLLVSYDASVMGMPLHSLQEAIGFNQHTTTMPTMQFIERGGLGFKQPYQLSNVTAFTFGLRGSISVIQDFCDATVNHGSDSLLTRRYEVVSPIVVVSFMNAERITSLHPDDQAKGAITEREVNFTIPLVRLLPPPRVVYYMASLWVDDGAAMCAGREIYGYPKQLGKIAMPAGLGEPANFEAHSRTIKTFAPAARCMEERIIHIARTGGGSIESKANFSGPASAFVSLMSDLMGADLPPALGSVLTPVWEAFDFGDLLTLVFLKQLRHIADGAHACYQAVTETPFAVTALSQAHILDGDYDITIPRFDSVPLAADFGLLGADSQGDIHQQAKFAYFLNFDFRLEAGKEVWVGP